ncbi:MAG: hypothetical protein LBQ49_02820 [Rickettsiales bacterium]|jgi:hypothetical protein|nr:hypothetical protein [Rickettsiales bacterium]
MDRLETNNGDEKNAFADAEHLWFWFVSCRRIKNGFGRRIADAWFRPCELLDVEVLLTQMYLSGRIGANELEVLKKYGEMRRAPNQHAFDENQDAALWASAIRALARAARNKGWVE